MNLHRYSLTLQAIKEINCGGKRVFHFGDQPTNHPQNADEIDKKLKSQEESLRKISEGSSIGEEEDKPYLASFKPNFICGYVRVLEIEDLPLRQSVLGHGEAA